MHKSNTVTANKTLEASFLLPVIELKGQGQWQQRLKDG